MRYFVFLLAIKFTILLSAQNSFNEKSTIQLPNGWSVTKLGKCSPMGDLPIQLVVHPSENWLIAIHAGQSHQSMMVYNTNDNSLIDSVAIDKTFYGGVFSGDGKEFYVSGGNNNWIEQYHFYSGKLSFVKKYVLGNSWPVKISPSGICMDQKNSILYCTTKEDSSIYQIDVNLNTVKKITNLQSEGYGIEFSENTSELMVSEWGNKTVAVVNVLTGKVTQRIRVGSNPNELKIDYKKKRLFVCCGNENSVYIVSLENYQILEVLNTSIYPNSPIGSTPNSLDFDFNRNLLFVANADNNNIAIFDIKTKAKTKCVGFVPCGWYPTQVKYIKGNLFISNAKGFQSMANPNGPNPIGKRNPVEYQKGFKSFDIQYIGGLYKGVLQKIKIGFILKNIKNLTKMSALNIPYRPSQNYADSSIPNGNPIPQKIGDLSPIKHVFYIIKENRTYDQVLADVQGGDGDTSLLLFGENVTPNQHKLVKEFVLLDHFYVDAEVSADGHNWSTAAIANDYTEKTWPTSYGGRGGSYVYEGQSKVASPKDGFIWDHAARQNITYRTYGEFADDYKPNIPVLNEHFCKSYTSWDEKVRDTARFFQWKTDFDSLLKMGAVPKLNTLRFINDHTEGVRKGRPTPFAHIADNDYAVGLFIEYLSKSPIWASSVVFILEDDAQNGADHIDAHRSTAYIAGGFVKRKFIDHTSYTTSSMLRTIELILGMKPMSQFDAAANSLWRCFSDTVNLSSFQSISPIIDLNEINSETNKKSTSYLMKKSELLNLDKEDVADESLMNELLWKYVRGINSEFPKSKTIFYKY